MSSLSPIRLSILLLAHEFSALELMQRGMPGMGGGLTLPLKAKVERWVESFKSELKAGDPIGTELLVLLPNQDLKTEFESIFNDVSDQVRFSSLEGLTSMRAFRSESKIRNELAEKAQGHFLCFVEVRDQWKPGWAKVLEPKLKSNDLILVGESDLHWSDRGDWLEAFFTQKLGTPSSALIRRDLFEKIDGYTVGFLGELAFDLDYDLWIRALTLLKKENHTERFELLTYKPKESYVDTAPRGLAGPLVEPLSAMDPFAAESISKIEQFEKKLLYFRERATAYRNNGRVSRLIRQLRQDIKLLK